MIWLAAPQTGEAWDQLLVDGVTRVAQPGEPPI